jgi:hypothetical protein
MPNQIKTAAVSKLQNQRMTVVSLSGKNLKDKDKVFLQFHLQSIWVVVHAVILAFFHERILSFLCFARKSLLLLSFICSVLS